MGAMSRNKGAAAERELARLLSDELGVEVARNLLQVRNGGHDLDGIPGWCLEVKRRAKVTEGEKREWWAQAFTQAALRDGPEAGDMVTPAVVYRADRQGWRVILELTELTGDERVRPTFTSAEALIRHLKEDGYEWTADISLPAFCQLVRESL